MQPEIIFDSTCETGCRAVKEIIEGASFNLAVLRLKDGKGWRENFDLRDRILAS